jgi:kynurenine formamidase
MSCAAARRSARCRSIPIWARPGSSSSPERARSDRTGCRRDLPVHRTLLSRGVALLEGLLLSHVEPGDYGLVAVPLAFELLDSSPVRAVLIRQTG